MFRKFTPALFAALLLPVCNYAQSGNVIPTNYTDTAGGGGFGIFSTSARSYQWLIDSTLLTPLMNDTLTGISFRGLTTVTNAWPDATTVTINNYDLYMGKAVLIQNATAVFTQNQSGPQTQVRSGSLVIPPGSYPGGGITSWGPVISFNTPYIYTGGNLSILLRHSGFPSGLGKSADALTIASTNYNHLYKATYENSYTGVGNTPGNFALLRFIHSATPLPVELISFTCAASGYDAHLYWESASEKNVREYIVQKSRDGIQFQYLQSVQATGQDNAAQKYTFTDVDALKAGEMVFYRLQMVDNDGSFKYSNINKINNGKVQSGNLIVYPNPVQGIGNISYTLTTDATITCQIYDITGKLVYNDIVPSLKGNNVMLADFSGFKKGYYRLKLTGAGIDDFFTFIKD